MNYYDIIIIGAGIAGATVANTLKRKNQKVLVVDKNGIASGGSGAAGAFVSPKIGKGSSLQRLTNESFSFSKDFYKTTCPKYFHQTGVIRIPKNETDAEKFHEYEKYNENIYERYSKEKLETLGIKSVFDSFYFPEAGDCDAKDICNFLLKDIEVVNLDVLVLKKKEGIWLVGEYSAHNIILATGFESDLVDIRYMGIHGTWGTRGNFKSKLALDISMHKDVSVGANVNSIIKLGATHEKEIEEILPCKEEQALKLKEKASSLIDTLDLEIEEVFCGMRAGSKDYFPLVGKVIDVDNMLKEYPDIVRGAKEELKYIDNMYILNGLGGRGFVFAPYMASLLSAYIIEGKEMDKRVNPDRLFFKWARKLNNK
ncbi:MAG: FAD-binding oxidoreductase [Sulfurovum sp.]|nr:FAD-binding oxidoreductase [Sulfurovum sp.]